MTEATSSSSNVDSIVSKHQSTVASDAENEGNITLLWFDRNIISDEGTHITMQRLREINDCLIFHTELEPCLTFIRASENEKIFLITSGTHASELLPHMGTLHQIHSIFIFCITIAEYEYLIDQYPKIVGIYTDLDPLCASIQEQIDLVDKELLTFSFFDQHQALTEDLSKYSAEFLWFQLFTEVILSRPRNHQQTQKQMIDMCRHYYRGNDKQQKLIDEFEHNYRPDEAIRWYSKRSFVYKLVNNALRTKDIDQLYILKFFISDLSKSLAREHKKILQSGERILALYREAKISTDILEKFKENEGKLISTNGFLFTNLLRPSARIFTTKPIDAVPVLFEIRCDVQQLGDTIIFANIAEFTEYPNKREYLFNLGTSFLLESIRYDEQMWLIQMNASTDGQAIAHDYIEMIRRETQATSVAIIFGSLMCEMHHYDNFQKYFEELLVDPNGEDLALIEFNIGRALDFKREWTSARCYYDRAYDRMINVDPSRIKDSAYVLKNIGNILNKQEKYNEAIEFYQQALKIFEKYYSNDHLNIACTLNMIGTVFSKQEKYDESFKCYQRALNILEKYDPACHREIAISLSSIGIMLKEQEKYGEALEFCQRALQLFETYSPTGHPVMADCLITIGSVFNTQEKHDEALEFYQRALTMREDYYPISHPIIAESLYDIGSVLNSQGKYDEALDFFQRGLQILEKYYSTGHPYTAASLRNIGMILQTQGKYDEALKCFQQALKIFEKYYPIDNPDIAYTLNSVGDIFNIQEKYNEALELYQRALKIFEEYYPTDHPVIADSLSIISRVLSDQGKYDEAFEFYERAFKTLKNYDSTDRPNIAASLNTGWAKKKLHPYEK